MGELAEIIFSQRGLATCQYRWALHRTGDV